MKILEIDIKRTQGYGQKDNRYCLDRILNNFECHSFPSLTKLIWSNDNPRISVNLAKMDEVKRGLLQKMPSLKAVVFEYNPYYQNVYSPALQCVFKHKYGNVVDMVFHGN